MSQKVHNVQDDIDVLFNKMTELKHGAISSTNFASWEDLKKKLDIISMALSTLQDIKEQELLAVNLRVYRIINETGNTTSPFKDDITKLYQLWEDVYEQNGSHLTELHILYTKWGEYETKYRKLCSSVQEQQTLSNKDDCDKNVASNDDDRVVSLEEDLKELQNEAAFLESRLKGGPLWTGLEDGLRDLESRVQKMTDLRRPHGSCAEEIELTSRSAYHPKSSVVEEDDENFEDVTEDVSETTTTSEETDEVDNNTKPSVPEKKSTFNSSSKLWRIFRAAIPIQVAVVFLYCLAVVLEPHCCDLLNNFNFSLSPQLRYIRGPPPV